MPGIRSHTHGAAVDQFCGVRVWISPKKTSGCGNVGAAKLTSQFPAKAFLHKRSSGASTSELNVWGSTPASSRAISCPGTPNPITYRQLDDRTKLLGETMIANGIYAGDRVGIFAGNVLEYVEVVLATARIGVIVLLNTLTFGGNAPHAP